LKAAGEPAGIEGCGEPRELKSAENRREGTASAVPNRVAQIIGALAPEVFAFNEHKLPSERYSSREAAKCESPARKCRENNKAKPSPGRDGT
jgi:hypothetical protein